MRIERVEDPAQVNAAAELFDKPPLADATRQFLEDPGHHLMFAFDDEGRAIGMVSGVEMTHPDKGTEMFLYELGVAPDARGRGVATALVDALVTKAKARGCYGMWVATDADNAAALATYRRAGAGDEGSFVMLSWDFAGPPQA